MAGALAALRDDWARYLGASRSDTPDPDTNAMLNFWNQVQCRTTLYWSRFVSGYETGLGRGMGTRDSAQDTLGTMHTVPGPWPAGMLTSIWHLQFADGHAWHQFFPLTGEGGPGLAAEYPGWPQWFSDDHLWLIIATCAYLRETGDFDLSCDARQVARTVRPRGDPTRRSGGTCCAAVDFTLAHRGPHGLPRSGFADWDDTLNVDHGSGKAESVWSARCSSAGPLLDLAELCDHLDRRDEAARFARPPRGDGRGDQRERLGRRAGTRAPSTTTGSRSASPARRATGST